MIIRSLTVVLGALALSALATGNALVNGSGSVAGLRDAQLWSRHPDVEVRNAMHEIAVAGGSNQPVGEATFDRLDDVARKAPLAPEPFLAHAVKAQLSGDPAAAARAFEAAERRDPRSLPAHYFLADHYLKGRDPRGIVELALLARLAPSGPGIVAPFLAQYSGDHRHWMTLERLFDRDPALRETTLSTMAQSPGNADAVVALTPRQPRRNPQPWISTLLASLVGAGDFAKAREIWSTYASSGDRSAMLYDGRFVDAASPTPFNWALTSSTIGLAERSPGGLHILFYGQEDGVLASQLLTLSPGAYRLAIRRGGGASAAPLTWTIRCAKAAGQLASLPLAGGTPSVTFQVPPGCAGQWIELSGASSDMARQSDVTIAEVRILKDQKR